MKNDTLYNLAQGIIMKKLRYLVFKSIFIAERVETEIEIKIKT